MEVPELFTTTTLSNSGISQLSSNVLLLEYVRGRSALTRAVAVLKTRSSDHDQHIRAFEITPDGILLSEPLDVFAGEPG